MHFVSRHPLTPMCIPENVTGEGAGSLGARALHARYSGRPRKHVIPLIMGPSERAKLAELRAHAERRENWRDLRREALDNRSASVPGDSESCRVELPSGIPDLSWRVVYSIDVFDDEDLGLVVARHMSMTIRSPVPLHRVPGPQALEFVAGELGFSPDRSTYLYFGPLTVDGAFHLLARYEEGGMRETVWA